MGIHARSFFWPSAVVTTALLAALLWLLMQEPPPLQIRRLPDGTILRLEAVTLGPEHRFVCGRRWQRLLASLLPPGSQRRTGATVCTYGPTEPKSAVFWMSWQGKTSLPEWTRKVTLNESGTEVEITDIPFESGLPADHWIRGVVVPAFPRRGAWVRLHLYESGRRSPVAEFRVPNPARSLYPIWTESRIPGTKKDGALSCTLTRLETGRVAPAGFQSSEWNDHWTRFMFRLRERGQDTDRWKLIGLTLTDATGNRITPDLLETDQRKSDLRVAFFGNLPTDEAAWKLRAEFVPVRSFASADLWHVGGVPILDQTGHSRFSAANRKRDIRLDLKLEAAGYSGHSVMSYVKASIVPRGEGLRALLVRATDNRGQKLYIQQGVAESSLLSPPGTPERRLGIVSPVGRIAYPMTWPPAYHDWISYPEGTQGLGLTFAVVRSRFAEFVVRPSQR